MPSSSHRSAHVLFTGVPVAQEIEMDHNLMTEITEITCHVNQHVVRVRVGNSNEFLTRIALGFFRR